MDLKAFIVESLEGLKSEFDRCLEGLTPADLAWQPAPKANSIGFLFWHVARVEDRLITYGAQGKEEVWRGGGWQTRWGIPVEATGFQYPPENVAAFPIPQLTEMKQYLDIVRQDTLAFMQGLDVDELDRPAVRTPYPESPLAIEYFKGYTVAQMFRHLILETGQHLGQIGYLCGLLRKP